MSLNVFDGSIRNEQTLHKTLTFTNPRLNKWCDFKSVNFELVSAKNSQEKKLDLLGNEYQSK